MLNENCLVWNVQGLNSRARRNVVHELVDQESISLLSLQETKLEICLLDPVREICGASFAYFFQSASNTSFAYFFQPASNTCGGILLAWRSNIPCYRMMRRGGSHVSMVHKRTRRKSFFWTNSGRCEQPVQALGRYGAILT